MHTEEQFKEHSVAVDTSNDSIVFVDANAIDLLSLVENWQGESSPLFIAVRPDIGKTVADCVVAGAGETIAVADWKTDPDVVMARIRKQMEKAVGVVNAGVVDFAITITPPRGCLFPPEGVHQLAGKELDRKNEHIMASAGVQERK